MTTYVILDIGSGEYSGFLRIFCLYCTWIYFYLDKFEDLLKRLFSSIIFLLLNPLKPSYSESAKSPKIPKSPFPPNNKIDKNENREWRDRVKADDVKNMRKIG